MPGMQHDAVLTTEQTPGWSWTGDVNAFAGFNGQQREFTDFHAWESQNWMMFEGAHRLEGGAFRFVTMFSLEPFTLHKIGSPQVFQTGETFHRAPLTDYQHPHDLFMALGADYRRTTGRATYLVGADVVGSPTLGPMAFMHRPSAYGNPEAPLSHHYMDSTHLTPGVVRAGVTVNSWGVEASWFRGEEPDEKRTDLDLGALDSYAMRVSWMHGPWAAQASGARLHMPDPLTPADAGTLTGSVAYTQPQRRVTAWMFGFGQKREIHGNFEAYLLEATIQASTRAIVYARAESVDKDILDAGPDPVGFVHVHRHSQVGALTIGYLFNVLQTKAGVFGVGADITGYSVPLNLEDNYGSPHSYHLFVHYSLRGAGMMMRH
jgi:hypothetical protein